MKNYLFIVVIIGTTLMATACSEGYAVEKTSIIATDSYEKVEIKSVPAGNAEVDVDLTALSSVMVYGEVFQITTRPEDYLGKTIKVSGAYSSYYYDKTQKHYHYVVVEDATACCQQGLEFALVGDEISSAEYPEDFMEIEIVGEYKSYYELGQVHYYLAVDSFTVKGEAAA